MVTENVYVQWIGFLSHLFNCVRNNGWLAAEDEILQKDPTQIKRFPLIRDDLYYEFASDIITTCVNGHDIEDIRRYARCAMDGLDRSPPRGYNKNLIHCIWNGIDSFLEGMHPRLACEFARVSIPYNKRPKQELFARWLSQVNEPEPVNNIEELYIRADAFIKSIKA